MQRIADDSQVAGAALDVDTDAIPLTTIKNLIVLDQIAIRPKIDATCIITKQDARFATVMNAIVPHYVVGIAVSDGYTVAAIAIDKIVLCQSVLNTPAPEYAEVVSFQSALCNARSLRA